MFLVLKGIRWFEWMALGVVIAVVVWGYLNAERIETLLKENAEISVHYDTEKQTSQRKTDSYAISDEVMTEFVKELVDAHTTQQKVRDEVIDDYIRDSRGDSLSAGEPVATPVTRLPPVVEPVVSTPPPPAVSKPQVARAKTPPVTVSKNRAAATDAALVAMADRMRERYCQAQHGDPTCSTQGPNG